MLEITNLEKVKDIAKVLLYLEVIPNEDIPIFVYHPFFEYAHVAKKDGTMINIVEDEKGLEYALQMMQKRIEEATNYSNIYYIITKPYRLFFYKETKQYLSEKEAGNFLVEAWRSIETPNVEINDTMLQKLKMFKEIRREYLMSEDEC